MGIKKISTVTFIKELKLGKLIQELPDICAIELPNLELLSLLRPKLQDSHGVEAYFPSDISKPWIESTFCNMDLFSNDRITLLYDCEKIKKEEIELIFEYSKSSDKQVLLIFNKESSKKWKGDSLKITAPPFWEGDLLFQELLLFYELRFPSNLIKLVSPHLSQDCYFAFDFCRTLKSLCEGGSDMIIDEQLLKELLPTLNIDQFRLVEMINRKQIKKYFCTLGESSGFEELSSLISFSISHLHKILGGSDQGVRLNKYQRNLMEASKIWSEVEVSRFIGQLKDILIDSRMRNKKAFIEIMKASI